jgi:hypothetical protein
MAITPRTVVTGGVWGENLSDLVQNPNVGIGYRDSTIPEAEIKEGWLYGVKADSSKVNEMLLRLTTLMKSLEQRGILPYNNTTPYETGSRVLWTDGFLYSALQNVTGESPAVSPAKWQKGGIESTDKVDKVVILPGGTNLNTVTTSGFYRLGPGNTNGPTSSDNNQLLVMHGGQDTITQILGSHTTGDLFTRSGNPSDVGGSGVWTSWKKLAFTDSPVFTGNPTAPTPAAGDSDTSLATTAFTQQEITSRALDFTSDATALKYAQSTGNIDTVKKTGIYFGESVVGGIGNWWYYHVVVYANPLYRKVTAYSLFDARSWVKTYADGVWSAWVQLTDANGKAVQAVNADTVDGQHFSWANSDNNPTYLWGANANGQAFLASREAMSVNYANSAGSVAGFAQSLASSGYQKLPSGLITQWGSIGVTTDANVSANFATSFPNVCLRVFASMTNASTNNDDVFARTISYNQSGATFRGEAVTGTVSGTRSIEFLAIGY